MIKIKTLASGSTGNAYRLTDGKTSLLVECGIPIREIKEGLNFRLSEIDGCLISHSHLDHSKSFKNILRAGIPVFTGIETIKTIDTVSEHKIHGITPLKQFKIGTFTIIGFPLVHDVPNLGFLIASGKEKLCFITDTAYCGYRFNGLTHIMVECNYQDDVLQQNVDKGICSVSLKNRIIETHSSLKQTIGFLQANDLSEVKEIHLIHLSDRNSDAEFMRNEVIKETGKPVYI